MGILNKFRKNKSGNVAQTEEYVSAESVDESVDEKHYDISDEVLNEGLEQLYQAADNIINDGNMSKKVAAASMKMLEIQLKDSYLVKGKYQSIESKNKITNFIQSVRNHCERIFSGLSQSENTEVNKIVSISKQLLDETYYVENYEIANNVREANTKIAELKSRNSPGITIVQAGLFILFLVCALYFTMLGSADNNVLQIASIVGAVVLLAGLVFLIIWQKKFAFRKARRIIRKFGDIIDFEAFNRLDQMFDGNYEQALMLKEQHQKIVDQFFYQSSSNLSDYDDSAVAGQIKQEVVQPTMPSHDAVTEIETNIAEQDTSGDITSLFGDIMTEEIKVDYQQTASKPEPEIVAQPQKVESNQEPKVTISFCMMCGTKVSENAVFCPNCGSKLEM